MAKVLEFKPRIGRILKMILSLLTQLTSLFLKRIEDTELRLMASGMLASSRKTIEVLSDTDPDDAAQLRKVLNELLSTGDFKQGLHDEILQKIAKLSNANLRKALTVINNNSLPITALLTDDDKDNTAQIKAHLVKLLRSEDGMELLNSLLSLVIPEDMAATLTLLIITAIITWLEGDEVQGMTNTEKETVIVSLKAVQSKYENAIAA